MKLSARIMQGPAAATQRRTAEGRSAAVMGVVAASLFVFASLHMGGLLGGGSKPFRPNDAGIAEAITGVVLAFGSMALVRRPDSGRTIALVAIGFTIVSFVVGLNFTARGGDATDIAYHAIVLPLLLFTFGLTWEKTKRPVRSKEVPR